jgi:hypothetical protein
MEPSTPAAHEAASPQRPTPTRPVAVRYLGFQNTDEGRAYTLRVDGPGAPRTVVVTIPHSAFQTKKARFQDAPEICFVKLQRELASNAELPDGLEMLVSADDMDDYREGQTRRTPERKRRPRPSPPTP